jgi:cytochrome b561/polyisoprenoid-binding protein YceI
MHTNTLRSYGRVARTFHWLTALMIGGNVVLGLWASRLPLDDLSRKVELFSWHKTLGVAIFAVASLRILWAVSQPRPAPLHPERRAETLLAEAVHWLLYGALVLVPLTGWIEHAATEGYAPILWPLGQELPLVPNSPTLAITMAAIHHVFAWLLIGTVLLHVAGALKHALIDRDGVLARMLSGRPAGNGGAASHGLPALAAAAVFAAGTAYALTTRPPEAGVPVQPEQVASEWQVIDKDLGFTIRQMGSEVQGGFSAWTAAIAFDPATGEGSVRVVIDMTSVTIGTVTEQAKGADFFDVAQHPTAVFEGVIRPQGEGFVAEGPLTLKGATVPLSLPFALGIEDGVARMEGTVSLDRRNWAIGTGYADEATVGFGVDLAVRLSARR